MKTSHRSVLASCIIAAICGCKGQAPERAATREPPAKTTPPTQPASNNTHDSLDLPPEIQQLQARIGKLASLPAGLEQTEQACASNIDTMGLIEELSHAPAPSGIDRQRWDSTLHELFEKTMSLHRTCTWEGDALEESVDAVAATINEMQARLQELAALFSR